MIDPILEKIEQIAEKAGVGLCWRVCDYAYDGETIALCNGGPTHKRGYLRGYSDILHDIAHYLCADEFRRHLPEFGLGSAPDADILNVYESEGLTVGESTDEEAEASLLGILFERELGLDYKATWMNHNWYDSPDTEDADKAITKWRSELAANLPPTKQLRPVIALLHKGLIDNEIRPTIKVT